MATTAQYIDSTHWISRYGDFDITGADNNGRLPCILDEIPSQLWQLREREIKTLQKIGTVSEKTLARATHHRDLPVPTNHILSQHIHTQFPKEHETKQRLRTWLMSPFSELHTHTHTHTKEHETKVRIEDMAHVTVL